MVLTNIKELIRLTNKKIEALSFLYQELQRSSSDVDEYFSNKGKVEKALLRVDIEFLNIYNHLLSTSKLNAIGELPKEKYPELKELKEGISAVKDLEKNIVILENTLLSKGNKNLKHQAPRAVQAYKKNKNL